MTYTVSHTADAQFNTEVAARFSAIVPALNASLARVNQQLLAWQKMPGYEDMVLRAQTQLCKAFDISWTKTTPQTAANAGAFICPETALATLQAARNHFLGYKMQMMNPQLLAMSAIEGVLHEACKCSGVSYEGSLLQHDIRTAMQPLRRLPQFSDHEMGL